jgi:hypothetical protein
VQNSQVFIQGEKAFLTWHNPFLLCLLCPVFLDFFRKFVPLQPNSIVPAGGALLVFVFWFQSIRKGQKLLSARIMEPVLLWVAIQGFYALLGAWTNWRLPLLSVILRIAPVLMIIVAARNVPTGRVFNYVARGSGIIPIILLPIGLIVIFFGNSALPVFLRPIKALLVSTGGTRAGFEMCSATFGTPSVFSASMLAILILVLTAALLETNRKNVMLHIVSAASALVLIYASTRRGALYLGLIVFFLFARHLGSRFNRYFPIIIFAAVFFFILDKESPEATREGFVHKRSDFLLYGGVEINDRFNEIFVGIASNVYRKFPFGTYLGFAGREYEIALHKVNNVCIETGAAQTIAETGFLGAIVFPLSVLLLFFRLRVHKPSTRFAKATNLLMAGFLILFVFFFTKEIAVLSAYYLSHILFWSIPGLALVLRRLHREELQRVSATIPAAPAALTTGYRQ